MNIRTFQPGDDIAQVGIYNEAASGLPRFKPATLDEVRRRCSAADFDPTARLYAVVDGRPVAYVTFQNNGRISFPWSRKGHEAVSAPLFLQALETMKARGLASAFAAYRGDWTAQRDFFLAHGFTQSREVLNFIMDLPEMPTPAARTRTAISPFTLADLPALVNFTPQVPRLPLPELERYLFHNPYFRPTDLFAVRHKQQGYLNGVGLLIINEDYADPNQVDANMPCFRHGAFGTEGYTTKRVNGLFSLLVHDPQVVSPVGLDLLSQAAQRLQETEVETLAAQVITDAPHLVRFYKQYFRLQGRFPLFDRVL